MGAQARLISRMTSPFVVLSRTRYSSGAFALKLDGFSKSGAAILSGVLAFLPAVAVPLAAGAAFGAAVCDHAAAAKIKANRAFWVISVNSTAPAAALRSDARERPCGLSSREIPVLQPPGGTAAPRPSPRLTGSARPIRAPGARAAGLR